MSPKEQRELREEKRKARAEVRSLDGGIDRYNQKKKRAAEKRNRLAGKIQLTKMTPAQRRRERILEKERVKERYKRGKRGYRLQEEEITIRL